MGDLKDDYKAMNDDRKERHAAASAIGIIGQALLRHSVGGIALRASDCRHPISFR